MYKKLHYIKSYQYFQSLYIKKREYHIHGNGCGCQQMQSLYIKKGSVIYMATNADANRCNRYI